MNDRVAFASDIHLDHVVPERIARFQRFLLQDLPALGVGKVYLLGDVFNIWYKDPMLDELYGNRILELFSRYLEMGYALEYVVGNRDFALCFDKTLQVPFPIHPNGIRRKIGHRDFFLCHGDNLCRKDYGYHILHGVIRRDFPMAAFHGLGSDAKKKLVNLLVNLSHHVKERKARWKTEPHWPYLERMVDAGLDVCVQGHKHEQTFRVLEGKRRTGRHFILPRWQTRASGLIYSPGEDRFSFFDLE